MKMSCEYIPLKLVKCKIIVFFVSKSAFRVLFILSYVSGLFVFFSNVEDFLQFAFDSVFSNVLLVFMKISFSLRHQWLSFLPKY